MSIRELYRVLTRKENTLEKINIVYNVNTGDVKNSNTEAILGEPCASPINFNRKVKRSICKNEK